MTVCLEQCFITKLFPASQRERKKERKKNPETHKKQLKGKSLDFFYSIFASCIIVFTLIWIHPLIYQSEVYWVKANNWVTCTMVNNFEIQFLSASENFDDIRTWRSHWWKMTAQIGRTRYKNLEELSCMELVKNSIFKHPVLLTSWFSSTPESLLTTMYSRALSVPFWAIPHQSKRKATVSQLRAATIITGQPVEAS